MMAGKRIDANQPSIVKTFRTLGCHVAITSSLGGGFPDVVVSTHGVTCLVEIKDGSKVPSRRRLTEDELMFHNVCSGYIAVIESEEQALGLVHEMRQRGARL
jgi:hypothetical protein|tara:strand:+ start:4430 stop:4735 length:306 start_codon:yes stop_codon:yes gene_type:complete